MDHDYIEQTDLVDRYLIGRMTAEEGERFEEHFIDCPECIDRLKTTRDFKQGLRLLTVQEVSREQSRDVKILPRPFLQRYSWKALTFAACGLLLVTIFGSILLVSQFRRLRHEADQAKENSSEWQRRYEEQQQATLSSEQQRQETERNLGEQVSQLKSELQDEQKQRPDNAGGLQSRAQPAINLPMFVLSSVRGGGLQSAAEGNEINLPHSPTNFVMSVPLDGETKYKTYRVTILAGQQYFWGRSGFKPNRFNSLTMFFNSSFFRPGDYLLTVEGVPPEPDSSPIGSYPFSVVKQP